MHHAIKLLLVILTVAAAGQVGTTWPVVGGILVSAPLKIPFAAWWVYDGSGGDVERTYRFLDGALWGLVPTAFFVVATMFCIRRGYSLAAAFMAGFLVWFMAALLQHYLMEA